MNDTFLIIGGLILAALCLGMLFYVLREAIKWGIEDAKFRGKDPLWVCAAVILFFPWGLIAWLLFRPDPAVGYVRTVIRK